METAHNEETTRTTKLGSYLQYFSIRYLLSNVLANLLSRAICRIITIVVFIGVFASSVISVQWISTDSNVASVVPDDSYVLKFIDALEAGFGDIVFGKFYITIENTDFSNETEQVNILTMIEDFEGFDNNNNNLTFDSKYATVVGSLSQWLDSFLTWQELVYNLNDSDIIDSLFYEHLTQFTNDTIYHFKQWKDLIIYDKTGGEISEIKATRFTGSAHYVFDITHRWLAYDDIVKVVDENSVDAFVFSAELDLAYFAHVVVDLTVNNLIFAALGVFAMLCLLFDFRLTVFILICIVFIDVDLMGWMNITGTPLDIITYGILVMAVGLTVDYIIHIAHAIGHVNGDNIGNSYYQRLEIAFKDIGIGVTKGAFTTFLGVVPMAFSQSEAFRSFFIMLSGIIIISVLHGFLFIPAVMGQFSCIYQDNVSCKCCKRSTDKQEQSRTT